MVDRYTKIVLTVIAACLLWLCATTSARPVEARQPTEPGAVPPGVQPVVIVGWGSSDPTGRVTLRMTGDGTARRTDSTVPVRADASIPVRLPYSADDPLVVRLSPQQVAPLAVSIAAVQRTGGPWDPIRADVEPAPPRLRPGGGDR
jgi:hypothetical protein